MRPMHKAETDPAQVYCEQANESGWAPAKSMGATRFLTRSFRGSQPKWRSQSSPTDPCHEHRLDQAADGSARCLSRPDLARTAAKPTTRYYTAKTQSGLAYGRTRAS